MTASQRAAELVSRVFGLLSDFKAYQLQIAAAGASVETKYEAASQADAAACSLAALYNRMSGPAAEWDLFTDAHRDQPEYGFNLPDCDS